MRQKGKNRTINTRSYFSRFILLTAPTPSTATSIVHPKTCKNLLDNFLLTASSSTNKTRGGTAHPGTYADLRTRRVCTEGARVSNETGAFPVVGDGLTTSFSSVLFSGSGSRPLSEFASKVQLPFASSSPERGSRWPSVNTCKPSCEMVCGGYCAIVLSAAAASVGMTNESDPDGTLAPCALRDVEATPWALCGRLRCNSSIRASASCR